MDRSELAELHYILPIANLPSVLAQGILSHERARQLEHSSVAMAEIQSRRARVTVPGARRLHEYVNLYVNARNPMLYKRLDVVGEICVLQVDTAVLDLPGVIVADQNAGSDYVRFAPAADGLKLIEKDVVFAQYWTHGDAIEQWKHKSRMCCEVLVPDVVPPKYIRGAYAASPDISAKVQEVARELTVTTNRKLFFR